MSKEEKIKHLENLIFQISGMYANQYDIKALPKLIRAESVRENSSGNSSELYLKDLNITINKQLKHLVSGTKKPEKRNDEIDECKSHFKQDMNREIGRLKFR